MPRYKTPTGTLHTRTRSVSSSSELQGRRAFGRAGSSRSCRRPRSSAGPAAGDARCRAVGLARGADLSPRSELGTERIGDLLKTLDASAGKLGRLPALNLRLGHVEAIPRVLCG